MSWNVFNTIINENHFGSWLCHFVRTFSDMDDRFELMRGGIGPDTIIPISVWRETRVETKCGPPARHSLRACVTTRSDDRTNLAPPWFESPPFFLVAAFLKEVRWKRVCRFASFSCGALRLDSEDLQATILYELLVVLPVFFVRLKLQRSSTGQ